MVHNPSRFSSASSDISFYIRFSFLASLAKMIVSLQVPKPFAAFFSDDKLEAMRVKKQREGKEREDWTADEEMARVENMAVDHGADDADDGMADDGMDVDGGYDE